MEAVVVVSNKINKNNSKLLAKYRKRFYDI